jgi:steroid delta-isomerase-like uncharacterized protein
MKKLLMVIPLVFLLCFTFGCQKQVTEEVPEGITEEEAKAFMDATLEIWNEGNLDLVDEFYSADYVRHYVDMYEDIVGIDAYKQWITNTRATFPDFNVTQDGEMIAKGDKIVSRWIVDGTNTGPLNTPFGSFPSTGKKVRFYGVLILHIVDGKIAEEWLYYNQSSLLQQLGFTFIPPQSQEPPEEKK